MEYPKFRDLPKDVQERIRDKARWEHMTLSAVIREWSSLWEKHADGCKCRVCTIEPDFNEGVNALKEDK